MGGLETEGGRWLGWAEGWQEPGHSLTGSVCRAQTSSPASSRRLLDRSAAAACPPRCLGPRAHLSLRRRRLLRRADSSRPQSPALPAAIASPTGCGREPPGRCSLSAGGARPWPGSEIPASSSRGGCQPAGSGAWRGERYRVTGNPRGAPAGSPLRCRAAPHRPAPRPRQRPPRCRGPHARLRVRAGGNPGPPAAASFGLSPAGAEPWREPRTHGTIQGPQPQLSGTYPRCNGESSNAGCCAVNMALSIRAAG